MKVLFKGGPWDGVTFEADYAPTEIRFNDRCMLYDPETDVLTTQKRDHVAYRFLDYDEAAQLGKYKVCNANDPW